MRQIKDINHLPSFFIAMSIAAVIACVVQNLFSISYWIAFLIALSALLINGIVALFEDELPGGFNNPRSKESKKD